MFALEPASCGASRVLAHTAPRPEILAVAFAALLAIASLLAGAEPAAAQFVQQGQKLTDSGAGAAEQGQAVALSSDGNTAIVGAPFYGTTGTAYVYTRAGAVWTLQTTLVGSGANGNAHQGSSVAISGDGNTAVVGGPDDQCSPSCANPAGAVWVFTRNGDTWTQQGSKLVGTNGVEQVYQGGALGLDSDGNTLIVGASFGSFSSTQGKWVYDAAAFIYSRSEGSWTQQAAMSIGGEGIFTNPTQLTTPVAVSGDGNTAIISFGSVSGFTGAVTFTRSGVTWQQSGSMLATTAAVYSAAFSFDGTTALLGGAADSSNAGAAWAFTWNGSTWTQQSKMVGNGAVGSAEQGYSVTLSSDGNTAVVGGPDDNSGVGASWIFVRSAGTWAQTGNKLVGSGSSGSSHQGWSVALSAPADTALIGGPDDASGTGAAWAFVGPAPPLTASPLVGPAPLAVTFSASDLPPPMTYTINFGDGTTGALTQSQCIGIQAIVGGKGGVQCSGSGSHSYASVGTYMATLLNASGATVGAATIEATSSSVPIGQYRRWLFNK